MRRELTQTMPPCSGVQRGSVLVAIIFAMVIVAGLGAAMLTMFSTSTMNQFGAMDNFRAYYLAEAGGRYAMPIIKKNINDSATLLTQLNGTFTLANNDSFQLTLTYAAPIYTLVSTGILNQGSQALNATRAITYTITGPVTTDIPFNNGADLSSNWNGYDPAKTAVVNNIASDNAPALNVAGTNVALKLAWNGSASLPNLANFWTANDGLLSYQLQVKIKIEDISEYMIGLSFRDRTTPTNSRYGLSFVKKDDCSKALPSSVFCSKLPNTNTLYVVLWKNIGGVYSVLRYHEALGTDNILNGVALNDWSTLVVKLEEQYVLDAFGQKVDINGDGFYDRKNLITAFIQGTSVYPRNTMAWDYTKFILVAWDPISGSASPVEDTDLTSENFADTINPRPTEIGLHAFYPDVAPASDMDKQFLDDFSLTLGSGGSLSVKQY